MTTKFNLDEERDAAQVCGELEQIISQRVGVSVRGGTEVEIAAKLSAEQVRELKAAVAKLDAPVEPLSVDEKIAELEARLMAIESAGVDRG